MSGSSFGSIGGVISSAGSAVTDLMSAAGSRAEASSFGVAAELAGQNAFIAQSSGAVQEMQANRQIVQTVGAQRAEIAAGGFQESGSALDLLSDSSRQGALTKGLIEAQTGINVNAYKEQEQAYTAEQNAAESAAKSSMFGSLFSGGAAVAGLALLLL